MDLTKLRNNQIQLIEYMKKGGYSKDYVRNLRYELNKLFNFGSMYETYLDYYNDFIKPNTSESCLKNKRIYLTIIMNYDLYNQFPNRKQHKNKLINDSNYSLLNDNFKLIIDTYKSETKNQKRDTTIYNESSCCSCFLMHLQNIGYENLNDIKEKDILDFFLDLNGNLKFSNSYEKKIRIVLKTCIPFIENCEKVVSYLPKIKYARTNIDYLTSAEIEKIKAILDNNSNICLRDKAIVTLLLYTGMRACDISNLKLSNIDWTNEKINIIQSKTNVFLELPLTTSVGNALYNYIVNERPKVNLDNVFIRTDVNYPITTGCVGYSVIKVFKEANIRQTNNKRKGTHIFRYNLATSLLKNEIPQPIISQVLGHSTSKSLVFYLSADLFHLKQCSLSIEQFENIKEVIKCD